MLHNRWGIKLADQSIHKAACEAEQRYYEGKHGLHDAGSRSPLVALADDDTQRLRAKSLSAAGKHNKQNSSSTAKSPRISLKQFHDNYLTAAGVNVFTDLDTKGKAEYLETQIEMGFVV